MKTIILSNERKKMMKIHTNGVFISAKKYYNAMNNK